MTTLSTPDRPAAPALALRRNRAATALVALLSVALGGVVATWYLSHPTPLSVVDGHRTAVTGVGQPVYVGVFTLTPDAGRTLHIAGVKVRTEATVPVEVTPLMCASGSVGVTSDPAPFCSEVRAPAGGTLAPGDSIMLRVVGEEPGAAFTERIQVSYRDGVRAATQPAGSRLVTSIAPGAS